jgi:TRAP-type mannitol/chloroaromatic compound transport system permease small subunit
MDILGILAVVTPMCLLLTYLSWPMFQQAWTSGEMSQNAGGLIRWPVLLMMPLGFVLLLVQAFSELIKRLAFLTGHSSEQITPELKPSEAVEACVRQPGGSA